MPKHIVVNRIGRVGKITLAREHVLNALTPELMAEVMEAVSGCEKDPEVRALVFTGQGRAFSSGADFAFLEQIVEAEPFDIKNTVYSFFQGGIKAIKLCSKPTIASVNGPAIGAGCEVALACDFRLAAEDAVFSEAWINLGVVPPSGGCSCYLGSLGSRERRR